MVCVQIERQDGLPFCAGNFDEVVAPCYRCADFFQFAGKGGIALYGVPAQTGNAYRYGGKQPGGSNDRYQIEDADLDSMIMTARESTDQEYRKTLYKACLDKIVDWSCEVPIYQRQDVTTFSAERINIDTITPDISTYYKWYGEIENMQLKQ